MAESDSVATSMIAVQRGVWDSFCPNLPAEVAAMVAPPVTVSTFPLTDRAPLTGPALTGPALTGPALTGPALTGPAPAAAVRKAKQEKLRGNMPSGPAYGKQRRG
jgi:hypothetical protein